jgi:hypothetical protein
LWIGGLGPNGYGGFNVYRDADRTWRAARAHRVAYEIEYGPIPRGLHVLHRCDTRLCVRPSHLWLGTNADNVRDKMAKGRHRVRTGVDVNTAKLTPELVAALKIDRANGSTYSELVKKYGIAKSSVARIVRGQSWKSVA